MLDIFHHKWVLISTGILTAALLGALLWFSFEGRPAAPPREAPRYVPEKTRALAPDNVRVPEKGDGDIPAYVAVPEMTAPAGPHTSAQFKSFRIAADRDAFSPNTVIVRRKDTVRLEVHAEDRAYNFVQPDYGFNVPIARGETAEIEFNAAAPGIFTFYCDICENGKVEGKIVVTE